MYHLELAIACWGVTASKSRQVETGQVSAQESSLSDEEEEEEEIKEDDEASADSKWTVANDAADFAEKKKCGVLFQESLWIDLNTIEPDNETPNLIQNSKNWDFEATKPYKTYCQNQEIHHPKFRSRVADFFRRL